MGGWRTWESINDCIKHATMLFFYKMSVYHDYKKQVMNSGLTPQKPGQRYAAAEGFKCPLLVFCDGVDTRHLEKSNPNSLCDDETML